MQQQPARPTTLDPTVPTFSPAQPHASMSYAGVRCVCGSSRFRISGWLRVADGRGGLFWRSLTRVWREARQSSHVRSQAADDPGPVSDPWAPSPLRLPISLRCDACTREVAICDDEALVEHLPAHERPASQEALRCSACRRGEFEVVIGIVGVVGEVGEVGVAAGGSESKGVIAKDSNDADPSPAIAEQVRSGRAIEVLSRCDRCHREARIAWSKNKTTHQQIQLDLLYGRR